MLRIKNLSFRYRKDSPPIIQKLNLKIDPGEKILIAGKNGAGKTTLSKILSGLIPTIQSGVLEGDYLFKDKPLGQYTRQEIAARISILFQDFETQIVSTSVKEEMLFYLTNLGVTYNAALARIETIMGKFNLLHLVTRDVQDLSGGEKQKIALLSLLVAEPEVLILDEPFTDIDPESQDFFLNFLGQGQFPGTLILFEQVMDYYRIFDRIILLDQGEIVYDGDKSVIGNKDLLERIGLEPPGTYKIFPGKTENIKNDYRFDNNVFEKINKTLPPSLNQPLVKVQNLGFKYKGKTDYLLKDLNLEVMPGDFIVVLGANGSGKTTLMKLIAGILSPTEGNILYREKKVKAGNVGYVYQNPDHQIFTETVYEEIAFGLKIRKLREEDIKEKTLSILKAMGLLPRKDEDPFSLPKGDREKVACASIIVMEQEIIILDEPTTGLDYPSLKEMMEIIKTLNEKGKTILMITHSMETAGKYGNKILGMAEGKIVYYGPKREFFADKNLLEKTKVTRTELMELGLTLNNKLLLNTEEFTACWKKQDHVF